MSTGSDAATPAALEFYWRPGCPFCVALRHRLGRRGIPVHAVNIWEDPTAAERVRQATGGDETVPTVFVGDRHLVNPSIRQVETLLADTAPHLLDQAAEGRKRRRWFR